MCGVFGAYTWAHERVDVARLGFFALFAQQHRGQESAGIATSNGRGSRIHKGMGLVTQVFNNDNLAPLAGHLCIAHNRYSTTGGSHLANAQPYLIETMHGPLAVGHNGNLTNVASLRSALLERGVGLTSSTDTEVITQLLAAPPPGGEPNGADWLKRIEALMRAAEGAYSVVVMTRDAVWAFRDASGLRPLCVGELLGESGRSLGYVVASESCALATVGARFVREIEAGEAVRLDARGLHSFPIRHKELPSALCVFEYVYFARPDSSIEQQTVHGVRQRLGAQLWREAPVEADVVVGVPDSATPAAIGFARASKIPYSEGLTKNRYIGRTFIEPTDRLRRSRVTLKYNPLRANLEGQRVVLVDDSIVRGNTIGPLVRLIRDGGGAKEVHVRVSSPPVRHPCFMGVDMATHEELIGYNKTTEEIAEFIGADSLAYLSIDGMMSAVRETAKPAETCGHCDACFSGDYPLDVSEWLNMSNRKGAFDGGGQQRDAAPGDNHRRRSQSRIPRHGEAN